jgi:hypothetical protein
LASANNYRNLDGTIVTNNIILQPYTSVVLKNVSITTGVYTKAKASIEIKLFPNPASDKLYIAADDLLSKPMIHIFNLLGEELYYAPYSEYIQLPEEWANGLYLLELSNENGSAIKRFALTR